MQQTVRHGRRAGVAAALGAALGNSTHMVTAGAGVALFLKEWPGVLAALQVAGALYLMWLGISALWRAWTRNPSGAKSGSDSVPDAASALRQGLFVTLLNPSIVVFYLTVVSSFVDPAGPPWMFFALGAIHVLMACTAHLFWATAFGAVRHMVARPSAGRVMDVIAGLALLALGVWLLLSP